MSTVQSRPILSLASLALQHCLFTLLIQRTTVFRDPTYFPTNPLLASHALRFVISAFFHSSSKNAATARTDLASVAKFAPVAGLYLVSQYFRHFALQRLWPMLAYKLFPVEIIFTAVFSVILLKKPLGLFPSLAMIVLTIGACLSQFAEQWLIDLDFRLRIEQHDSQKFWDAVPRGYVLAVLSAALAALANVLLEKVMKSANGKTNLWSVNMQLAALGAGFTFVGGALVNPGTSNGWDRTTGKESLLASYAMLHALGGMLLTWVVYSTDNIRQLFSSAYGLITSSFLSFLFFSWVPSRESQIGTLLSISAFYIYNLLTALKHTPLPTSSTKKLYPTSRFPYLFPIALLTLTYLFLTTSDPLGLTSHFSNTKTQAAKDVHTAFLEAQKNPKKEGGGDCNNGAGGSGDAWDRLSEEARKGFEKEDEWKGRDTTDDEKEIEYIRGLAGRVAVNGTIVFIPTNANFITLAMNLECSLRRQGITNVLFWALDAASDFDLRARGIPTYFNPSLYGTARCVNYHEADYNRMMRERPKVWGYFLRAGISFLWMDADITMLGNPFHALRHDADIEIQSDGISDIPAWISANGSPTPIPSWGGCAGLFLIRATKGSIYTMKMMELKMEEEKNIEDQQALGLFLNNDTHTHVIGHTNDHNQEKSLLAARRRNPKIFTARYVDPRYWVTGHQLGSLEMGVKYDEVAGKWFYVKDGKWWGDLERPLAVHINGNRDKRRMMQERGGWFLDEGGRCLID
ncbi:hypothetical protein HK097_007416 [Rhizophlyctis rosea]|uniref:Nucleotide-diphospho-sugar transferase domain-containing protein n=1 Tax=Rhizophlyctis rosea TaxID=64517 RepID=A0AAD5SDL5_9FUNG|nr:hypothetical protein HK097_007416 [Rhizophlyctis rosea]